MPTPSDHIKQLHDAIDEEARVARWGSDCAGQVFVLDENGEVAFAIGNFGGTAPLAEFVVAVHNALLDGQQVLPSQAGQADQPAQPAQAAQR